MRTNFGGRSSESLRARDDLLVVIDDGVTWERFYVLNQRNSPFVATGEKSPRETFLFRRMHG